MRNGSDRAGTVAGPFGVVYILARPLARSADAGVNYLMTVRRAPEATGARSSDRGWGTS
jgi:hypothetical protein